MLTGHVVFLDRDRLELFCAACGDYVFSEAFDRALQVCIVCGRPPQPCAVPLPCISCTALRIFAALRGPDQ
jgi:hypothetical protein